MKVHHAILIQVMVVHLNVKFHIILTFLLVLFYGITRGPNFVSLSLNPIYALIMNN